MRTVCKHNQCVGCMACQELCAAGAICIRDDKRAYNAFIDAERCKNCGACHRVCQVNRPPELREPYIWKQGWAKDEDIRRASSSGGAARAIQQAFIRAGGEVCSCTFAEGEFVFAFAEGEEELEHFVGSKYVKSNPAHIYGRIKEMLEKGQKLLFTGLPCQSAALQNFVGTKLQENLYTLDLICHGTPSPQILRDFLAQYDILPKGLQSIRFRAKTKFRLEANESPVVVKGTLDAYTLGFLKGLFYTENCYYCPYARRERVSDISLGDAWGSRLSVRERRKGISLLLCQTKKGEDLLAAACLTYKEVEEKTALAHNGQLCRPSGKPKQREFFFAQLEEGAAFNHIIKQSYPLDYMKQLIKGALLQLRLR